MKEKNIYSIDCTNIFDSLRSPSNLSRALVLNQTFNLLRQLLAVLFYIIFCTIAFLIQNQWKVQVNVVTPQVQRIKCGESNAINGEKNCFVFDYEEKNCLLLIKSELGVEKSLIIKKNQSPPRIKWSPLNWNDKGTIPITSSGTLV